jgi:hypothetical protein
MSDEDALPAQQLARTEPQLALQVEGGDRMVLRHDMTAVRAVAATARFDVQRVRGQRC